MTKTQALRLIEVTSQTQVNNGTQCFHDPLTNTDYMSYESGYVRRKYSTTSWRTGRKLNTIYQLNKTRQVPITYTAWNGTVYNSTKTERILEMNSDVRLDLICRATVNFRKTLNIR